MCFSISIHLMLLFNCAGRRKLCRLCPISIHLMLLFNKLVLCIIVKIHYFNTSNVTIQRSAVLSSKISKTISIHLMLLFNLIVTYIYIISIKISIHLMLLFNTSVVVLSAFYSDFNTSNVTIQHYDWLEDKPLTKFQYI